MLQLAVLVLGVLVFMSLVMAAGWATQRAVRNGGWTDVFWTFGTGAALVAAALWPQAGGPPSGRPWLVAALLAIWALRLGSYVALRVARSPEDARYARFRRDWGADFQKRMFWFLQTQAPASAFLAVSVLLAARNPAPGLRPTDWAGAAILALGIAGEALADAQMHAFRRNPANHGKVCTRGLWGWSRHPNYFFEWLVWIAYPVIAAGGDQSFWWVALSGPAAMLYILTRVTGLPPLEEAMLASRGEAYAAYQRRVSAFVPLPPRRSPAR